MAGDLRIFRLFNKKGVASRMLIVLGSPAPRGVSLCAVSSVVEHLPDTEGVTGSNPVSRTILIFSDLWLIKSRKELFGNKLATVVGSTPKFGE